MDADDPRRCTAQSKQSGERCKRPGTPGTDPPVCYYHGGWAGQTRQKAEQRLARQGAEKAVQTYGLPREVEPHQALLEELHRTAGHVAWLGALIANLEHGETGLPRVGGDDEGDDDMPERSSSGTSGLKQYQREKGLLWEKPSVYVEMYQHERAHLARVAKDCLQAGVEERRVRIEEQQAELIARAFRAFAIQLGHDLTDPKVHAAFRGSLELVAGEAA